MLSEEKQLQFAALRRRVIAQAFGNLNPRQLEGVLTTEGPLLLLAGAGSGKTTVLDVYKRQMLISVLLIRKNRIHEQQFADSDVLPQG